MSRQNKLIMNTISAFLLQIVTLICAFILPKHILKFYGSEINGLVSSISWFLGIISFLELGIGPVIQSNLYKPFEDKDEDSISKIVVSAERFYRKIAYIFCVYIFLLLLIFPKINAKYSFGFTATLLLIISVSIFAQYYFGITYQVFLIADQKTYIPSGIQIITVVFNTILSVLFIHLGYSIHVVKLLAAFVYIIRPLLLNAYVHKNYNINHKVICDKEPIKQKWNGFAQHLAAVVCNEVDVVLLTFLSTYQNVSIYSIYLMITNGILTLVMNTASGIESFWGNMIARKEEKQLFKTFEFAELLIHIIVCVLFVSMGILIAPFVLVYVNGIEDAGCYNLPLFGMLMAIAYGCRCLRTPYFIITKAAGHYKETQNGAIISMLLNIVISLALIMKYGLIGTALGTLVAMLYHTIYFAWYLRKNIINRPFKYFVKHMVLDIAIGVISYMLTMNWCMGEISYMAWFLYAVKVTLVVMVVSLVINFVLYNKEIKGLIIAIVNRGR